MSDDDNVAYGGGCVVEEFDGKRVEVWLDDDDVEWLRERKMFLVESSTNKPWSRVANGIMRPPIRIEMDVREVMDDATCAPSNSDSEYDFTYHSEMMDVREVEIRATRNGKLEGVMIKHLVRPDLHGREIWDFRDEIGRTKEYDDVRECATELFSMLERHLGEVFCKVTGKKDAMEMVRSIVSDGDSDEQKSTKMINFSRMILELPYISRYRSVGKAIDDVKHAVEKHEESMKSLFPFLDQIVASTGECFVRIDFVCDRFNVVENITFSDENVQVNCLFNGKE